ncbi:unnamed protein product [Plutella xylostella]|uniref:(diamondback moth) hypothetical protein n=1 Tax=Plutella xylostella TaxID=51655 RepID=A0A8S4GAY8_PLUXY|nr:unnamed protein product [Plutella xylostella]
MTISYAGEVPNGSSFGCFWRILLKTNRRMPNDYGFSEYLKV